MTSPSMDDDFGPWQAVLCDSYGFCYETVEEAVETDDNITIKIVKGSAAPTPKDGGIRCPGHHLADDVLYEVDGFVLDAENIEMLWERAKRVAHALNLYETQLRKEAAEG